MSADLATLEALLAAKRRSLSQTQNLVRGDTYTRRRAEIASRVELLTRQLAQLDSEYENAASIVEQTQREIDVLVARIKHMRNAPAIDKLLALAERIQDSREAKR